MKKPHIAIAIDGPCGVGKTTQAKRLAHQLQYLYVDTGALYRAFAVHKLWLAKESGEPVSCEQALRTFDCELSRDENGEQRMLLWGENINPYLRTEEVSMEASVTSADPQVREALLIFQQRQRLLDNVVMEGRDIGTVVFPDAEVKIFLTADAEVRAKRRYYDLLHRGEETDYNTVLGALVQRDYQDSHRAVAPLMAAPDAVTLDCSNLDIQQTTDAMLEIVKQKLS